jgi:hypothetical protein
LAVAVGDFNGDGKLDLALVTGSNSAGVIILLGNGDGTFTPAPGSPVAVGYSGRGPTAVAVADFNGDGKLDLAVASDVDDTVAILLGNGDGTFAAVGGCCGTSQPYTHDFTNLGLGDFNGNGKLDLALAIQNGQVAPPADYVNLMVGNGDGTFTPGDFSVLQDALQNVMAVADFNGDGQLDIAMTDPTYAEVTILLQAPPPGNGPDFSLTATGSTSVSVQPGGTASYPLQVTSLNGFIGTVSFSCSGAPANATCSLLTYNGAAPEPNDFLFATEWGLFQLSVQTTAPTMTSGGAVWPRGRWPLGMWAALLGLICLATWVHARPRSPRTCCSAAAPLATLLTYVVLWAGCGSGSATPHPVGGTPPGTYTLTVTATSGSITHSTTVTLVVQ